MGHVAFSGNLVDNPELKKVNGTTLAEFRVASTPRIQVDGRWTNGETVYVNVTAWRGLGENVAASCKKGQRVVVTGEATQKTFTKKDGSEGSSTQVQAEDVGMSMVFHPVQKDERSQSERGLSTLGETLGATVMETVPF
jgi:single-strand DNA-binding protein